MTSRANREAAKLTLSWLDEAGVKERDLQERRSWYPVATKVSAPKPYRSSLQVKRDDLLHWASAHGFPQMLVRLPHGRVHVILPGESSWRFSCRTSVIEIIESALEQSAHFQPESEEVYRGALIHLGRWRDWARFSFKPSNLNGTLFIGDGTEEAWVQFAQRGSLAQVVEAAELLEQEWVKTLLAWGEAHGWMELTYCQADGKTGVIPAGAESWRAFLEETDDLGRIQMSMEAFDLDELEAGRGE